MNYRDQMILDAPQLRAKPHLVPLSDAAGEIDAVGAGVPTWRVGDRVVSVFFGGYYTDPPPDRLTMGLGAASEDGVMAEFVVLAATRVLPAPPSLTFVEASTLPCAGVTAWNALQGANPVGEGDKVLVLGSGGVSLFGLAFSRLRGAQALATTGNRIKRSGLASLGANEIVNYKDTPHWGQKIGELTGGVDRVLNTVGAEAMTESLAALRPGGEIAVIGAMPSTSPLDVNRLLAKAAVIRGIAVGSQAAFREMSSAIERHGLKPKVALVLGFDELREAFLAQASGELFGKVVLSL
ncbi:MAG: NAD(P)-dependent alcohol dehydrogenase [Proteobacteria bacterium]|nr:NAD(P)-dependent alcohol dehydrogenase [Pseudomonadota bacterium]